MCIRDRVYGIPVSVQFTGIFYNKTVLEEAGITQIPVSYTHLDVYKRQVPMYSVLPLK